MQVESNQLVLKTDCGMFVERDSDCHPAPLWRGLGVFAEFERAMIQERVRAGLKRARSEGKRLGWPLEKAIKAALTKPGRTEGVRKIAERFGVNPGTVQRISRPFDASAAA